MTEIKIDKLVRSKRRTVALVISAEAALIVRAPLRINLAYLQRLVFQKRFWIEEKKKEVLAMLGLVKSKKFVDGEEFLYLGEIYRLKIEDCQEISLAGNLCFPQKFLPQAKEKMLRWYRQKALEKITERAEFYSKITGWQFKKIAITKAEKRWGSCSPRASINFSWRLIMAPLAVVDYVVVHELAHLPEKNHSHRFWSKVGAVLPDYKHRQGWLKANGAKLRL